MTSPGMFSGKVAERGHRASLLKLQSNRACGPESGSGWDRKKGVQGPGCREECLLQKLKASGAQPWGASSGQEAKYPYWGADSTLCPFCIRNLCQSDHWAWLHFFFFKEGG